MFFGADIIYWILSFLSLVDDYTSFDIELLRRRRIHLAQEDEVVEFAMLASGKGDLSKVRIVWSNVPQEDRRWVLYAAAACQRNEIVESLLHDFSTPAESIIKGIAYWTGRALVRPVRPIFSTLEREGKTA